MGPPLFCKDVIYKQVLTDPAMFSIIYRGASGATQPFHRGGMKQDEMLRIIAYVSWTNDGISFSWIVRL
jgi:cytochrome c-L